MKLWLAFIMVLFLTACASKPQGQSAISETLLQRCVPLLPVTGYDGKTVQTWMTLAALSYNACMGRQGRLVDAVRLADPRNISGEKPPAAVKPSE